MSTQPEKKGKASSQGDKVPLVTAPPYGRAYEGALARLSRDKSMSVQECDTHMDAVALLRKTDFAILVTHSATPDELVKQVTLLKLLAPQIKQKRLKVMATTAVKHESAPTSLNFYGASEVLTEPISEKALQFKLERMARSMAQLKARVKSQAAQEPGSAGTDATKGEVESEGTKRAAPQLVRKPALTIASDFWITAEIEVKRIRDRWLVHLIGPSPDLGKWLRVQGEPPGRQGTLLWQWLPTEPDGRGLYKEPGEWFFRGQRPEFQELEWLFVGIAPELFFKAGDKVLGAKIQTNERSDLLVARDSEASQALVPLVKDSLLNMGKKTFKKKDEEGDEQGDLKEKESAVKRKKKPSKEDLEDSLEVKEAPPLKIASDCWLVKDRKPKRIASRWVARIMGPTPDHGRWVRVGSSDLMWGWDPHSPENDSFIKEKGTWVFRGLPPKFQEDRWLFVADKPSLSFMQGAKNLGSKLSTDADGNLIVAQDSETASAKLPLIEESLRKIFKNKAEETAAAEARGEDAEEVGDAETEFEEEERGSTEAEESIEADAAEEVERGEEPFEEEPSEDVEEGELDEDEIEIKKPRKKRAAVEEEDDDEYVAEAATADVNEDELDASSDDEEESDDLVAEEEGSRKSRRKRKAVVEDDSEEPSAIQEGADEGKELSIKVSPDGPGKELEAVQEGPGEGEELSATAEADEEGEELEATQEAPDEGDELEAAEEGPKKKKSGSVTFEAEETSDHGKVTREDDESEDLGEVAATSEEEGDLGEVKEDKPVKPEDAKGIRAPGPPGPTLSPLALAFLVAELVNDRSKDLNHGAKRYCAYLSASCGGLQVELWCKGTSGWLCIAANEDAGKFHEVEAAGVDQEPSTKLYGEDTLVTPIRFKDQVIGALVIHGNGTAGVKHDYAEAAARVICGMAQSFSIGAVAKAA